MWILKSLVAIPGFVFGAMLGIFLFALLPIVIFATIWYGGEAWRHAGDFGFLFRPAAAIGGIIGAIASLVAVFVMTE